MSLMIEGGRRLSGDLTVQGAKNSVLPILAACILSGDVCVLRRCPHLEDVDTSIDILRHLGCAVRWNGPDLEVDSSTLTRWDIPDRLMRRMRSSVVFLGAILARCGQAELSYPGGCAIGPGPSTCTYPPCGPWGPASGRRAAAWTAPPRASPGPRSS